MDWGRERNRAGEKQERNAYGVYSHTRLRLSKPKCISSIPGSRKCKEMPNPHWMPELCVLHFSLEGAPPSACKTLSFTSVPLKESHRQTGPPLIKLHSVPFPWTEQRFLCSSGNTEEKMPVILFHAVNHSKQMGHSYGCTLLSLGLMGYQSPRLLWFWEAKDCTGWTVAGLLPRLHQVSISAHCSIWSTNKSKHASV